MQTPPLARAIGEITKKGSGKPFPALIKLRGISACEFRVNGAQYFMMGVIKPCQNGPSHTVAIFQQNPPKRMPGERAERKTAKQFATCKFAVVIGQRMVRDANSLKAKTLCALRLKKVAVQAGTLTVEFAQTRKKVTYPLFTS